MTIEEKWQRHEHRVTGVCSHNKKIECDWDAKCETCGWNPEVAAKRARDRREAMKKPRVLWRIGSGSYENVDHGIVWHSGKML